METGVLTMYRHPRPRRATHVVIVPSLSEAGRAAHGFEAPFADAAIVATQTLVQSSRLLADGYSLLISRPAGSSPDGTCFHLVAGDRVG